MASFTISEFYLTVFESYILIDNQQFSLIKRSGEAEILK